MLQTMKAAVSDGESFAFETTLAGVVYARRIVEWQRLGYRVSLFFLKLNSDVLAIDRVAERVRQGGHDIPESVIRRRYAAGWQQFEHVYRDLVDDWSLFDNSGETAELIDWGEK